MISTQRSRATFAVFGAVTVIGVIGPLNPSAVAHGENGAAARVAIARGNPHDWPMYNHDPEGTRWNRVEHRLGPRTVAGLREIWRFPTEGAVAGTPAVVHDTVYAVDSSGTAYAIGHDGAEVWRSSVDVPTSLGPKVTDSPLVTEGMVVFGDQAGFVHGLDVGTGVERWRVPPNRHPGAAIFGSATLVGRKSRSG